MTIEDAKVFLDNLKICISEHPIVADWLVEIADRKTEPTCSKMEQVDKDINVCSIECHYEPKDEPQICSVNGRLYSECGSCEHFKCTADEPQTETQNSNKNSNVISVYDGVSEAVRCAMCSNPNKSDRGCDGACSYDEKLYERIMKAIAESVADTPQADEPQIYGNEYNCIMTLFGDCSYAETGCGSCEVVEKVRKALDKYEPKDEPQPERQRLEGKRWTDTLTTEEKKCMLDLLI